MNTKIRDAWNRFARWWTPRRVAGVFLAVAILIAILGSINLHSGLFVVSPLIADFYANISIELASVAITVLLIDRLYQRHEENEERTKLINQLGSWDNTLAMQAADELRLRGWLQDGSARDASLIGADLRSVRLVGADLRGVSLHEAKLQSASLLNAKLQGANLDGANLEKALFFVRTVYKNGQVDYSEAALKGASLRRTNLHSAQVRDDQLAEAGALRGAIMPNGKRYNGRFNLDREFELIDPRGLDTTNPQEMADFYGVSLQEYEQGQRWAQENLRAN